jgi:phage-related protein
LHPVADKLSIDGLKLKGIPGLESLNKAIQDIGQQVSRMIEGLSNALSNLGGRKR